MFSLGKIAALAAPLALAVGLVAPAAATAQITPFIGQIQPFGNNFCPRGLDGRGWSDLAHQPIHCPVFTVWHDIRWQWSPRPLVYLICAAASPMHEGTWSRPDTARKGVQSWVWKV